MWSIGAVEVEVVTAVGVIVGALIGEHVKADLSTSSPSAILFVGEVAILSCPSSEEEEEEEETFEQVSESLED